MRKGLLTTALLLIASDSIFAQGISNSGQSCPCQNPPRLFPGLFARRQPATRVEPPLFAAPQPVGYVANANKQTAAPQPKILPAYLPPSLPTAPAVTPTGNRPAPAVAPIATADRTAPTPPNYDHLLDVSGHDRNYAWITGVLRQKSGLPGVWFIHYSPPDAIPDIHGGVLPIQTRTPLQGFRQGDLVTVIGYIITNADVAPNERMTAFAADQVNKVK